MWAKLSHMLYRPAVLGYLKFNTSSSWDLRKLKDWRIFKGIKERMGSESVGMEGRSGAFSLETVRTGSRKGPAGVGEWQKLTLRMSECKREGELKTLRETEDSRERAMEQERRERWDEEEEEGLDKGGGVPGGGRVIKKAQVLRGCLQLLAKL